MNRQIRRLAAGLLVCYVILFVQLNVLQVGRQRELNDNVLNTRPTVLYFNRPRGEIITADGVVAAMSVPTPAGSRFDYQRQYPTNDLLAQITGYYTFAFGSTQLERTQNDVLAGLTEEQQLRGLLTMFTNSDTSGDVVMTLDSRLQQVAKDALGDRVGSVVVIDPATGAVKAMWSYPSYDPNLIAVHDADAARAAIDVLQRRPGEAAPGQRLPGAVHAGVDVQDPDHGDRVCRAARSPSTAPSPNESEWTPPLTDNPIENYRGEVCGGVLLEVFRRSCNIPFAQTAVNVGARGDGQRHRRVRCRGADPDRPAPAGGELLRRRRGLRARRPDPGDARLRSERGADGAAAHGDGRPPRSPTAA